MANHRAPGDAPPTDRSARRAASPAGDSLPALMALEATVGDVGGVALDPSHRPTGWPSGRAYRAFGLASYPRPVESSDGHRTATPAPASPWLPLRTRIFLALFIAQLASNLGSLMHSVAAAWLMGDLGASAALVALVQTATFLPVVLVGMPAGALADVFDRRRLLIVTQSMMMGSAALMAALTFAHHITPVGVLGLTFLLGTGFALTGPAWSAIQPDLVPAEQFSQAVALNSMTYNVGRAVGPAVGGLVVAGFGAQWVFLLNAVSFIGTIAVVYAWRPVPRLATSLPAETFAGATRAGLRYGSNSPLLRAVLVRSGLLVLPGQLFEGGAQFVVLHLF